PRDRPGAPASPLPRRAGPRSLTGADVFFRSVSGPAGPRPPRAPALHATGRIRPGPRRHRPFGRPLLHGTLRARDRAGPPGAAPPTGARPRRRPPPEASENRPGRIPEAEPGGGRAASGPAGTR